MSAHPVGAKVAHRDGRLGTVVAVHIGSREVMYDREPRGSGVYIETTAFSDLRERETQATRTRGTR